MAYPTGVRQQENNEEAFLVRFFTAVGGGGGGGGGGGTCKIGVLATACVDSLLRLLTVSDMSHVWTFCQFHSKNEYVSPIT